MKSSIKRHLSYISDLMLKEEWEIKIIIGPGKTLIYKKF